MPHRYATECIASRLRRALLGDYLRGCVTRRCRARTPFVAMTSHRSSNRQHMPAALAPASLVARSRGRLPGVREPFGLGRAG